MSACTLPPRRLAQLRRASAARSRERRAETGLDIRQTLILRWRPQMGARGKVRALFNTDGRMIGYRIDSEHDER